jgi:hypothetical protein
MQIEKGIPVPEAWRAKKGASKYPFRELAVGDSFVIEKNGHKSWDFVFRAIDKAQKELGIKCTTRLIEDEKRRVWRTS